MQEESMATRKRGGGTFKDNKGVKTDLLVYMFTNILHFIIAHYSNACTYIVENICGVF